jgi:guanylate kinase
LPAGFWQAGPERWLSKSRVKVQMSHERHPHLNPPANPLIIVLSGLSGAGKDAVLTGLRKSGCPLEFIITVTTRLPRAGETDGIHYHFVSRERFQEMIDGKQLLEWASVYGNRYGVPADPVRQALQSGKDVIVKVDVQGAATIKKIIPDAVFIFLMPPSLEELGNRLRRRYTEKPPELEIRLKAAAEEIKHCAEFDYVVMNNSGGLRQAAANIRAIITAEKCRVVPRHIVLP